MQMRPLGPRQCITQIYSILNRRIENHVHVIITGEEACVLTRPRIATLAMYTARITVTTTDTNMVTAMVTGTVTDTNSATAWYVHRNGQSRGNGHGHRHGLGRGHVHRHCNAHTDTATDSNGNRHGQKLSGFGVRRVRLPWSKWSCNSLWKSAKKGLKSGLINQQLNNRLTFRKFSIFYVFHWGKIKHDPLAKFDPPWQIRLNFYPDGHRHGRDRIRVKFHSRNEYSKNFKLYNRNKWK